MSKKRKAIVITSSCKTTPVRSLEEKACEREKKELSMKRKERSAIDTNVMVDEIEVDFGLLVVCGGVWVRDSEAEMSDSHAPMRKNAPPANV